MKFNIFPGLIILISLIVIVVSVPVVPVAAPMSASANTSHVPARGRVLVHGDPMPARNDSSLPVLKRYRQPRVDIGVELRKRIHFLSFEATLDEFMEARNARHPMLADWTSDACTSWADRPFKFDFKFACYRHDFGYRNNPPEWGSRSCGFGNRLITGAKQLLTIHTGHIQTVQTLKNGNRHSVARLKLPS
ncbi:hypothetical protein IQ07DRAFT_654624 [Pyrenochaeta sp. DS3sAY3a]|nr:hypothetical protein IQ07DRAFT_654624 [Pyrenochaeta sp. DS3sAY3a]